MFEASFGLLQKGCEVWEEPFFRKGCLQLLTFPFFTQTVQTEAKQNETVQGLALVFRYVWQYCYGG